MSLFSCFLYGNCREQNDCCVLHVLWCDGVYDRDGRETNFNTYNLMSLFCVHFCKQFVRVTRKRTCTHTSDVCVYQSGAHGGSRCWIRLLKSNRRVSKYMHVGGKELDGRTRGAGWEEHQQQQGKEEGAVCRKRREDRVRWELVRRDASPRENGDGCPRPSNSQPCQNVVH
jgi:hypothetical protein